FVEQARIGGFTNDEINLRGLEAGYCHIKRILQRELLEVDGQKLLVPASQLSRTVLGDGEGFDFGWGEMVNANDGNTEEMNVQGRLNSCIACNHLVPGVDQHWVEEAKLQNRGFDFTHLVCGMGPGIVRTHHQQCRIDVVDFRSDVVARPINFCDLSCCKTGG